MAKSKPKKAPSTHSRASRRATSPSINTDKSLKNAKPPLPAGSNILHTNNPKPSSSSSDKPASSSTMTGGTGAGISKRGKKQQKSRDQRLRLEKAMLRAETVMDQMGKKLVVSRRRGRTVKDRSGAWEDINGRIRRRKSRQEDEVVVIPAVVDEDDDGWETKEEGDEDQVLEGLDKMTVVDQPVPGMPAAPNQDEDEIL